MPNGGLCMPGGVRRRTKPKTDFGRLPRLTTPRSPVPKTTATDPKRRRLKSSCEIRGGNSRRRKTFVSYAAKFIPRPGRQPWAMFPITNSRNEPQVHANNNKSCSCADFRLPQRLNETLANHFDCVGGHLSRMAGAVSKSNEGADV